MIESIIGFLKGLPDELITFILAATPVGELRISIPIGYAMGLGWSKTMLISYAGNIFPIIPLLLFLDPVSERLRHFRIWRKFFDWLFERTKKKADIIQRYEAIGLMIFVAIPLPGTGAWTGCIAASLFKIRFKYAFWAITAGVILAGIVVMALTMAGFKIYDASRVF